MTNPNHPFGKGPKGGTATKAAPSKNGSDDEPEPTALTAPAPTDPFASTPTGGGSDYVMADLVGELLLFRPIELDEMFTKVSKPGEPASPFIRAEIIRLENDNEVIEEMLIFQEALIRGLKKVMRGLNVWTIGRLYRGEKKGGKSAPYLLAEPSDEEKAHAFKVAQELELTLTRTQPLL